MTDDVTLRSLPAGGAAAPRVHLAERGHVIAMNALVAYAGALGLAALRFVTKIVLIRSLAPADFGRVVTTQNLLALFVITASLGINEAVVRFVGLHAGQARGGAGRVVRVATRFALALGTAAAVLLIAVSGPFTAWLGLGEHGVAGIVLAALAIVPTVMGDIAGGGFQGLNRMWVKVVILDLSRGGITLGGYLLMAAIGWATYAGAMSVHLAAAILSGGLIAVAFHRSHAFAGSGDPIGLGDLLNYSVPLFVSALVGVTLVNSGIPLVLAAAQGADVVAVYAVALVLPQLMQMPASALEMAALPVWASAIGTHGERQLSESFAAVTRWALLLGLLVLIPLATAPREWLALLFGGAYAGSMLVVEIALAGTLVAVAVGPTEGMLRALGLTRALFIARVGAGVLAVVLAWFLAHTWSVVGAIVAYALNNTLLNGGAAFYLYRWHGIHPIDSRYRRTLAIGGLAWLVCAVAAPLGDGAAKVALVVIVNTLVVAVAGLAAGIWSVGELRQLVGRAAAR